MQDPFLPKKDSWYPGSAAGTPRILLYIPIQAVRVAVVPEAGLGEDDEMLSIQQECKVLTSFFWGGVSAMFLSRASSAWTKELFLLPSTVMWGILLLSCSSSPLGLERGHEVGPDTEIFQSLKPWDF